MIRRILRVLLLEDSSADAELIVHALQGSASTLQTECVDTREAFESALAEFRPHVIVSDHSLANFDSISALRIARERCPAAPVILVTGAIAPQLTGALRSGADDFLLKRDLSQLVPMIEKALAVRRGLDELSPRQIEVLRFIAEGYTTAAIAQHLQLSAKTIETHRTELMKRLGIHDLATLVRFAIRVGLVTLDI